MGGGLMQLVAYGAQDIYLTGNPQITFFKVVYRRHTNFSMEAIKQVFNGSVGTSASTVSATISRNGDLVSNLWIEADITCGTPNVDHMLNWVNNTGHALIKEVEIEIGGQMIDRHYSQWLDIWDDLTDHSGHSGSSEGSIPSGKEDLLNKGNFKAKVQLIGGRTYSFYIPLQFWFCRHVGLSLPLIALQYHEVKLKLKTRALASLVCHHDSGVPGGGANGGGGVINTTAPVTPSGIKCDLWADYIYLDTDERRRFAQVSHEYLIEQVQRSTGAMKASHKLNFNHPVKELIWVTQDNNTIDETDFKAVPALNTPGWGGPYWIFELGEATADPTAHRHPAGTASGRDYFNYGVIGDGELSFDGVGPVEDITEYLGGVTGAGGIECIASDIQLHAFGTAKLKLNGHDRFKEQKASYFRLFHPMQVGHNIKGRHIYVYSFALKPEEHQPSGTCNFSRIDNASLEFTPKNWATTTYSAHPTTGLSTNATSGVVAGEATAVALDTGGSTLTVYAINYNVLRIMSGMGGLAYSN